MLAFSEQAVAEGSKERHEIRPKLWPAQITDSEAFRSLFTEGYRRAQDEQEAAVLVFADGARWIWNMGEDVVPHAVQMLDCSPAKAYLWDAAKILYGAGAAFVTPGGKERAAFLLDDKVRQVLTHRQALLDLRPALAPILPSFE